MVSWRISDIVVLESDERATFEEWAAALDAALAAPAYQAGMGVVHDARRASGPPSAGEARMRVEHLKAKSLEKGVFRYAILASSGLVEYGMGRLGEALGESVGVEMCVFRDDLAGAVAWASGPRFPGAHTSG